MSNIAHVAIPGSRHPHFDYAVPKDKSVVVGQRVVVSLGQRECVGVIVHLSDHSPHKQLKTLAVNETPIVIDADLWRLAGWMSRYYHVHIGELMLLLWPALLRQPITPKPWLGQCFALSATGLGILLTKKPSKAQRLLLEACKDNARTGQWLQVEKGIKRSTLQVCQRHGWLVESSEETDLIPQPSCAAFSLNAAQQNAVDAITASQAFAVFLLHGVTGSGKTEVYAQAISACLNQGKQALVLVPEIGLTEQTVSRFYQRCGVRPCVLHSHLSDEERWANWSSIYENKAALCIGTRSAVLAPFVNLGLIVIDEEHDGSYKQQSGVRYHARDVAVMRAKGLNIPIVLGTATPSLESLLNIERQRYQLLSLPYQAVDGGGVQYHCIDMRGAKLEEGISQAMKHAIAKHINAGEQVLVFINRRGYAPVVLCHGCGHVLDCPHCDAHLAWHATDHILRCHHCGYHQVRPLQCPSCKATDWIEVGVGTQRLEDALHQMFPDVEVVRIDRDNVQNKKAFDAKLAAIHEGRAQLLIGTQMIAKGHDFDNIGLVVLVDVDGQLYHPDFRAMEQFSQLLVQVAGRAGRRQKRAAVLLQTHHPRHPWLTLLMSEGYEALAKQLLCVREKAQLPPYFFHAVLQLHSSKKALMEQALTILATPLSYNNEGVDVLGPMPAMMRKKGGYIQYQVVFSARSRSQLHACLGKWHAFCSAQPLFLRLRWFIDVDPLGL